MTWIFMFRNVSVPRLGEGMRVLCFLSGIYESHSVSLLCIVDDVCGVDSGSGKDLAVSWRLWQESRQILKAFYLTNKQQLSHKG